MFLRGRVAYELIRELAVGVVDDEDLASRYEVSVPSIQAFKDRHVSEIDQLRDSIRDEGDTDLSGLWIANKAKRIAEYQDDVERINEALELELVPNLVKIKHAALHSVAEELAQLPQRASAPQVDEGVIHYTIVGSTSDGLKGDLT